MRYYLLVYKNLVSISSGEQYGTEYSMVNSCPKCGTNAKIVNGLVLSSYPLDLDFFKTLNGDLIISENINDSLKNIGVRHLQKAKLKGDIEISYYHVVGQNQLTNMLPESKGIITEDQCSECLRDGHFGQRNIPMALCFNKDDFSRSLDIYETWECTGASNLKSQGKFVQRFARPLIVVSDNVKSIFENHKTKDVSFIEVFLK